MIRHSNINNHWNHLWNVSYFSREKNAMLVLLIQPVWFCGELFSTRAVQFSNESFSAIVEWKVGTLSYHVIEIRSMVDVILTSTNSGTSEAINVFVQNCSNSIANAMELLQSCAKPSLHNGAYVTWRPLLGQVSLYPAVLSGHCNSFEDQAAVDEIYECPILR